MPFFNYPAVYARFEPEFRAALDEVGRRGAFILQREIEEFEAAIAKRVGVSHCITVANATVGLQLGLMAGGFPQGGEVIISTHTMVATASSIHFAGGIPVPVDVGSDHLIDPVAVREAISDMTVAICPTQLNGRTCDMDAIVRIAGEFGLDLYEDAAQGLGSSFKGRAAGSWGRSSCLSFYPAKILGALGDGGAVLTDEDDLAATLRLLRDHGRVDRGNTVLWGFNARMDNLTAAFLLVQLAHFDETVARRREIASRYQEMLSDLPGIALPPAPNTDPEHFDTYQNYELECEFLDSLQEGLSARGVGTLRQWGGWPIHRFTKLGFNQTLPRADELFARMVMLPMHPALTDADVDYVCAAVRGVVEEVNGTWT